MVAKAQFTVGVFAGVINANTGMMLLRRRLETGSIIPGQSFKGNWELPGGGVMETEKVSYDYLTSELAREVLEETGIKIPRDFPQLFVPFPFKGPAGYDLALVSPVSVSELPHLDAEKFLWAFLTGVNQLARQFVPAKKDPPTEGEGLLSGWGKRMHCMALTVFLSGFFSAKVNQEARDTLTAIKNAW